LYQCNRNNPMLKQKNTENPFHYQPAGAFV